MKDQFNYTRYERVTNGLLKMAVFFFMIGIVLVGVLVYGLYRMPADRSAASQKTAITQAPANLGYITGKVHTPGYCYTMHAQTGAKTVSMPEYEPDKYQVFIYGQLNNKPVSLKRTVGQVYYDTVRVGDTITLKP